MQISTIGIDLAKNVFQVHGVDAEGKVVLVRQLRRGQMMTFLAKLEPCLIGMEACATSHHWAREITKLGHEVKLIPPAYVKAYVKRQKNDAADAAAICEAVTRPSMRFVPVKSAEQQSTLAMHRTRNLLISQQVCHFTRSQAPQFLDLLRPGKGCIVAGVAVVGKQDHDQQDKRAQRRRKRPRRPRSLLPRLWAGFQELSG